MEVIGLYFSAHWCPPCRGFTPQLGKFYDSIKDSKNFEIIFVSSDRDASQFKEYYDEQADWAALPYKDRATKNALSKKYKVRGIPTLVILDGKTGETITLDGRDGVSSEPEAFPWKPPSIQDILVGVVVRRARRLGETPPLQWRCMLRRALRSVSPMRAS